MATDSDIVITSIHNPSIRRARSLLGRKGRREERAFLVEGFRAVGDMLAAGARPEVIFFLDGAEERAWASMHLGVPMHPVSTDVLASLSDVPHPQGVVAVVPIDSLASRPRHDVWQEALILIADGISDPGNLGTLVRSAAGAGVTRILLSPRTVDPFNPKCVRAAMGAHFLVSLHTTTFGQIAQAVEPLPVVAVADAAGESTYDTVDWTRPAAIVVGSEAFGPSPEIMALATAYVRIPLVRGLESLNAGVAGSLLVLEAARQRRLVSANHQPFRES